MNQDRKWFLSLLDEATAFGDAPEECLEEVWDRSLEIIHEAGDQAARLGLPQLVEKSRQFRQRATPDQAKAFLAECLLALRQGQQATSQYFTVSEAATRLKLSSKTVYQLCKVGQLRTFRAGRAIRVPVEEIERFEITNQNKLLLPLSTANRHGVL
jgi:excisionase family DNA binding protein